MTNGKRSFDKHVGTWKWLTDKGEGLLSIVLVPPWRLHQVTREVWKSYRSWPLNRCFLQSSYKWKSPFYSFYGFFLSQVDLLLIIDCHRYNPLPFGFFFLMRNLVVNKVRKKSLICAFVESEWPIIITNLSMLFPFKVFTFASFTNLSTDTSSKI